MATIKPNANDIATMEGASTGLSSIIAPQPMRTNRAVPMNSAQSAFHNWAFAVNSDRPT